MFPFDGRRCFPLSSPPSLSHTPFSSPPSAASPILFSKNKNKNKKPKQVAVDISHHANLLALHRKVSARDAVVGWFATSPQGAPPSGGDALIHDFYSRECGAPAHLPVHVTVDTSLTSSSVRIAAYSGRSLSLGNAAPPAAAASTSSAATEPASPGDASAAAAAPPSPAPAAPSRPSPKTLATAFVEIPFKVVTADAERLGAKLLTTELVPPAEAAPAESGSLDASLERLVSMLEAGARWCSRVAGGEAEPDAAAAAGLADALAALAPLPAAEVEQLAAGAKQDAMLLLYLSKLVSAHVTLSDRLGTAALPIL